MPSWLYDAGPTGLAVFLFTTVVLGGTAAFVSGRVIAQTWRPLWQIPLYMAMLALAVRFIHFSVFGELLVSLRNYIVDFVTVLVLALIGFRTMRARQMAEQYGWLAQGPKL